MLIASWGTDEKNERKIQLIRYENNERLGSDCLFLSK